MTRIPRVRLSATFSAAWRHTVQVRNRLSPSFHSPVELSRNRGVLATRNFATGWPAGVKRSSGSSTRLPTSVIDASFMILTFLLFWVFGFGRLVSAVCVFARWADGGGLPATVEPSAAGRRRLRVKRDGEKVSVCESFSGCSALDAEWRPATQGELRTVRRRRSIRFLAVP